MAFNIGARVIGGPASWAMMIGGAAAMGGKYALDSGNSYLASRKNLSFGTGPTQATQGAIDPRTGIGTIATMRQRSLAAMQRSHLNMRSAMGQEAFYMHR